MPCEACGFRGSCDEAIARRIVKAAANFALHFLKMSASVPYTQAPAFSRGSWRGLLDEQLGQFRGRSWPTQEKALYLGKSLGAELFQLFGGFDTLRCRGYAKTGPQLGYRAHDRDGVDIGLRQLLHETAIELDLIKGILA